ncbi:MAG TPA: tetratricopeptide repeat protein, partial [Chloroflexi bacterium]|nr:tetratricopeptide repeat protein [Chloroflexota bacterium]
QQGNLEEAAHCYEEALVISPKNSQVWRALGDTYIAAQEWADAIRALTHTLELKPNVSDAWNVHQVIARLYSQIGDAEQALFHAQRALGLAPENQQEMLQDLVVQIESLRETP